MAFRNYYCNLVSCSRFRAELRLGLAENARREYVIILLFLLFSDGILRFGSMCVCDVFASRVDIVVWNKKKFSRYDAARDSRLASVYTHAHRTTLNVEQTAVMVQFDFLIIIRLLSLTSPFRFDNSWKRLSSPLYQPRCFYPLPHHPRINSGDILFLFIIKNKSGISSCIYL